jgi:rod shape determining protein RodA
MIKYLFKSAISKVKSYNYKHINVRLLIYIITLTILGINIIASATTSSLYETKQVFGFIVGLIVMIVLALTDYKFIQRFYWLIYAFNIFLLLLVKFIGEAHMGAQRWIVIGGVQIQPSEFAKIFLILFFAKFIYNNQEHFNSFKNLLTTILLFLVPIALIYKQPALSTSIIIILTFLFLLYLGGLKYKIMLISFLVSIPIVIAIIYALLQPNQTLIETYQYNRLIGFFDEDNEISERMRYQQENSEMAIGSGGLWGKGLNNTDEESVKNGNYIPEPQTDFIFAIAGEELGFVGTSAILILLLLIVFECFYIGAHAPDLSGRLISCGIGVYIGIQTFLNIAVVTNMLPNTGLPLPFVSYGLSSLLSLFISMGIVLNIGLQHKKIL